MKKRMIGFCAGLGFFGTAIGQQMTVPVDVQYQLISKSLPYVKNLNVKADGCQLALIYQSKNRMSMEAKSAFETVFTANPLRLGSNPVGIKFIDLSESEVLENDLKDVSMVFIAPLRAVDIGKIVKLGRMLNLLTVSAVADEVKQGTIMGFDVDGGRPKILVNLKSAEKSGILFSADYLKLVRIVE
jgi:hypothetical protein